MTARWVRAVAAGGVLATVSACSVPGLQNFNLPGGATFLHKSYTVTVVFNDVTALQPQSSVRVDNVPVGDVSDISVCSASSFRQDPKSCTVTADDPHYRAKVTLRVRDSVDLPANSIALLEQTSLLGEKYVAIQPPDGQPASGGSLPKDGSAVIAQGSLTQPDIEEVFGALSLLLNGGGVEQLQTINTELASAFTGREGSVRDLLHQLNTLLGSLDQHRSTIVRALNSLDRFSHTLVAQRETIAQALTDIAPGLKVLADNEPDLTGLLQALARLGHTATRVIHETKANTVADLASLHRVLAKLAAAGNYLPHALEVLLDYPFPKNVTHGIFGDYTGLLADVDMQDSLSTLTGMLGAANHPAPGLGHGANGQHTKSGTKSSTSPTVPLLPGVKLPTLLNNLLDTPPLPNPVPTPSSGNDSDGLLNLLLGGLS